MKMVKCLPEFEYFTVFLKNRNFISKNKISKVTDYAALTGSRGCCMALPRDAMGLSTVCDCGIS